MSTLIRQALLVLLCAVVGFATALAAVASGWVTQPPSHPTASQQRLSTLVASDDRQISTLTSEIQMLTRLAVLTSTRSVTASITSGCPKGKAFYTLYDSNGVGPVPGTGIAICVPTG